MSKALDITLRAKDAASKVFAGAGNAARGLAARLNSVKAAAHNMAAGMAHVTSAARKAISTMGKLGGVLKGLAVGGLAAIVGAIAIVPRALGAMRNALEKTADSGGGAGAALTDTAEDADAAATSLDSAANTTLDAAQKAQVAFGAFGDVGAGFIQRQGSVTEAARNNAEAATSSAGEASEALEETAAGFGTAETAASRFGSAMDRIGNALSEAGRRILVAIAEAITPALEKFADFLERPAFKKFVDLLAKDLAGAIGKVADWLADKALPKIEELLERINEAGGPIEFFKEKWEELKLTALMVVGIIVGKLLLASQSITRIANSIRDIIAKAFERGRDGAVAALNQLKGLADNVLGEIKGAFETVLGGVGDFIDSSFARIKNGFVDSINVLIRALNKLIEGYNKLASYLDLPKLPLIPPASLAQGGIVSAPLTAVVGDNPTSPEVVAPLNDLIGIMREALGGGGGGLTINVAVPAGVTNPQAFGQTVGTNIAQEMRRRGLQVPTVL